MNEYIETIQPGRILDRTFHDHPQDERLFIPVQSAHSTYGLENFLGGHAYSSVEYVVLCLARLLEWGELRYSRVEYQTAMHWHIWQLRQANSDERRFGWYGWQPFCFGSFTRVRESETNDPVSLRGAMLEVVEERTDREPTSQDDAVGWTRVDMVDVALCDERRKEGKKKSEQRERS